MSDDLASRVLAAIEAKEAVARAAGGGEWQTECACVGECRDYPSCTTVDGYNSPDDVDPSITIYPEGGHDRAQAQHIADNDPADVIRSCTADKQIVEHLSSPSSAVTGQTTRPDFEDGWAIATHGVLVALAERYGINPDGETA